MTDFSAEMPLYIRREGIHPPAELDRAREVPGLVRTTSVFGEPAWLVTRYADVRGVLGDAALFSSNSAPPLPVVADDPDAADQQRAGSLLLTDPPEHTRLRRMLTAEFTARRISRMESRIERIVAEHLDAIEAAGPPVNLVAMYSLPVSSLVVCELLGVPYDDRTEFQRLVEVSVDTTFPQPERDAADASLAEYFANLADRARSDPGEDLLGMLIREHGDDLSRGELAGVGALLLAAGHGTTANMLAMGTLALLLDPLQGNRVRDEPAVAGQAVEELIRHLSVVHTGVARKATRPTVVGGQEIAEGDLLVLSFPAANHDPALAACPAALDIDRKPVSHLAFGHGVHYCIGAPLARKELGIAIPALLRRFPGLRLAVDPAELTYLVGTVAHGVRALPVVW